MSNTSARPITVDGVRLDTLAWNVEKITRATAPRRSGDQEVPGMDGVIPSLNDTLDAGAFGLDMFVRGTDADGATPPAGSLDTFRANLDELIHLFGTRHRLLDVREQVSATETRRAWCKVTDRIEPDAATSGSYGRFTVGMSIPYGVWEDLTTADWTSGPVTSGVAQEVTTLQGATERILDAVVLVQGPVTNPRLTDPATGAYVQYTGALDATQQWRINVGTWATRTGTTLNVGSSDLTGTDQQPLTTFGGSANQATFLPLVPTRSGTTRVVSLALTGDGITVDTQIVVRARRKYAL